MPQFILPLCHEMEGIAKQQKLTPRMPSPSLGPMDAVQARLSKEYSGRNSSADFDGITHPGQGCLTCPGLTVHATIIAPSSLIKGGL